ncbi:hypothetical protein LINPERHAP1_LOCUS8228, partial [Linum perenne]
SSCLIEALYTSFYDPRGIRFAHSGWCIVALEFLLEDKQKFKLPRCGEPFHELGTSNGDQFGVQTERESLKEPSG